MGGFLMQMRSTKFHDAWLIESNCQRDLRGTFERIFSASSLTSLGLRSDLSETSFSTNSKRKTLRGLHYQPAPHAETKLVRVVRGAIFDVILDIRRDSPTFGQWYGIELAADSHTSLYIPEGFAHGFLTLCDETSVLYHITNTYSPEMSMGVHWQDPVANIDWPFDPVIISQRDDRLPSLSSIA